MIPSSMRKILTARKQSTINKFAVCTVHIDNQDRETNHDKDIETELREQIERQQQWATMPPEQKKKHLLQRQREMLDTFLERNAISRARYEESLNELNRLEDKL